MTYRVRYFFDPGSGTCLWAANEAARERFGYAIEHQELPLSKNTKLWLEYLVAWFDTSIDWDDPGNSDKHWSEKEVKRFNQAAKQGIELLRHELTSLQYDFIDETNT